MSDPELSEKDRVYYAGEPSPQPVQRWTDAEKLALLDTHPMFTGRCPNCECPILEAPWECDHCGWTIDSINVSG